MRKTLGTLAIITALSSLLVLQGVFAQDAPVVHGVKRQIADAGENAKKTTQEQVNCAFEEPENQVYDAQFIATRKKGVVAKGELFETRIYIRNTGNVPWFSAQSGCKNMVVNLGTDNDRDRISPFFTNNLLWESGWAKENRIYMKSLRVDPGKLAEFAFWSRAPQEDGFFREIYTPVVEGKKWLENGTITSDIRVGNGSIPLKNKDILKYIQTSTNLSKINLDGDRWIKVDISEQRMSLMVGDYLLRNFPVSTGKRSTPTPYGETIIFQKQEVRVGGGYPHYIMPKWLQFRRGYGIHALPSLANDGGVFWTEALNHIGTPRSHGCIRLLPADAEFTYNFAGIGTAVKVVP
ncbi:L,D-transpeptidase [Patescibacteria group bacterium]|nr:L,D-transpeptidase [Patescibacteria group bacterium]MBU1703212.1 L,D-transpeptidase [Patescibacteria group bacterium]MBU1953757.1 L,D-transpeptidase [Patescibacteria group bacterium]